MSAFEARLGRAGLALLASVLSVTTVRAAEDADTGQALDEVTVFGSRLLNRSAIDSAVPIDVFTPADLAHALSSGELGQALQSLSPAINMPRASASGTSDSVRSFQFRGLAPDQVLVLVNGKRRHTNAVMDTEGLFPGTVAVDVNAIPPEAIERIEVLRDGAGAMYGSDAVAGVVNIVLKSGVAAPHLEASYGQNVSHFAPTDRTLTDGQNRLLGASTGIGLGDRGALRFGANYQNRDATNRAGPTDATFASWNSTPADLALNNHVIFASGDPRLESAGLFYDLRLPASDALESYSFATLDWRHTEGAAFYRYPDDPSNVPQLYPQGFRPVSTGSNRDFEWVAGARGLLQDWHYDLSVREGYDAFSYGLYNSVNASLGTASPTRFHVADFVTEQQAVNLDLTRPLTFGSLPELILSGGAEYLNERYHTGAGDPASYAAGPITLNGFGESVPPGSQGDSGLRPRDVVHLARHEFSGYIELEQEWWSRLLVNLAGRYSSYSDYGSSPTGKLALRYKLMDALQLRASVSNSFRAPALAQTGIRFATLNFNADGTGLANNAWLPPGDPLARALGATPLKAERSVNTTFGAALRPFAELLATLDFYQVRLRDRITPTGQIFALPPSAPPDIASVQYLTNALDTTTRGFDLVLSETHPLGSGTLHLSAAFNRNYLHQDSLRNPDLFTANVLIPLEYGTPSTKLVLGSEWNSERFGARAQATRFGTLYAFSYDSSLPVLLGGNAQRYAPAWSIDLEGSVQLTRSLKLALGGENVLNRYPDRTTAGNTYGGSFPYNFVHPIGLNGAYYYVTLSYGAAAPAAR